MLKESLKTGGNIGTLNDEEIYTSTPTHHISEPSHYPYLMQRDATSEPGVRAVLECTRIPPTEMDAALEKS